MTDATTHPEQSKRWLWIVGWLSVQTIVLYLAGAAWAASANSVDSSSNVLGRFPLSEYINVLSDTLFITWSLGIASIIGFAQLLFLWPVRKPEAKQARGWALWASLSVAGAAIAVLVAGVLAAATYGLDLFVLQPTGRSWNSIVPRGEDFGPWYILAACVLSWSIATPLLIAFCKRGPRESLLCRVASRLFLGTIIEIAAIIPLDVMVRRKGSCYCLAGTYFALCFCGSVAVFVIGPAILLPILARRRKRWYHNKCDACGYDMTGCLTALQCPECGSGWKVDLRQEPSVDP